MNQPHTYSFLTRNNSDSRLNPRSAPHKLGSTGVSILLVLATLAACGGGGGGGDGGGSTAAPPRSNVAGLVYVRTSDLSGDVSAYTIDASTGALSPAVSRAIARGFSIPSTSDPSGRFAYVLNYGTGKIFAYAIDPETGEFSEVAGSPFGAGTPSHSSSFLTVDPSGKFAYVANYRTVSVYAINTSTGALSEIAGSPFAVGLPVETDVPENHVSIDPSGKFAYVAHQGDSIWAYALNASTGALSEIPGSPFATGIGSRPYHVTFEPLGRFAYAVRTGGVPSLLAYSVNGATGALSEVAGSPFEVKAFPDSLGLHLSFHPSGRFAYVVSINARNYSTSTVAVYAINADNGALSEVPGSPFTARQYPQSVTVDPSGKFAYVGNRLDASVSAYTINPASGVLSEIAGSPFAAGNLPESVRVDPSGQFAYVANTGSGNVSAYKIDASTGALSEVEGSPFPAGGSPAELTITRPKK